MNRNGIGNPRSLRPGGGRANRINPVAVSLAGSDVAVGNRHNIGAWLANVVVELLPLFSDGSLHNVGHFVLRVVLPLQRDRGSRLSHDAQSTGGVRRGPSRLGALPAARRASHDPRSIARVIQLGSSCVIPFTHKVFDRRNNALIILIFGVCDATMRKRITGQVIFDPRIELVDLWQKYPRVKVFFQDLRRPGVDSVQVAADHRRCVRSTVGVVLVVSAKRRSIRR